MTFERKRPVFWATVAAMVCLLGIASARVSAQAAPTPQITDNVFRNIQVLKGIPVDTFFDVMGMFASSMGEDCTFCHLKASALNRDKLFSPAESSQVEQAYEGPLDQVVVTAVGHWRGEGMALVEAVR